MTLDEFTDGFHEYVARVMDEVGFRFWPMHAIDGAGVKTFAAVDLPPEQAYRYFWSIVSGANSDIADPQYVCLGLDRTTRPGQGTEFADVLTCAVWWNDPAVNWGKSLKVGVVNYQVEPRIVRAWDWENAFWNDAVRRELRQTVPPFRIKVVRRSESEGVT
jgi:hypothetical protein